MDPRIDTSCATSPFGLWLASHGGAFHQSLVYAADEYGTSVYVAPTAPALPAGSTAVSCPFALAITPTSTRKALGSFLLSRPPAPSELSPAAVIDRSEHTAMALYLSLSYLALSDEYTPPEGVKLGHAEYVSTLPKQEDMRTTLWWTTEELDSIRSSVLWGATGDRMNAWMAEWTSLEVESVGITWEVYLWASTILSSRAFASYLIDGKKEGATPILFPGVDLLNHRYGEKVTWNADTEVKFVTSIDGVIGEGRGTLSIQLDKGVEPGTQAFNTYGAKSSSEFLLGYGFTPLTNPSETVILLLALPPAMLTPLLPLMASVGIVPKDLRSEVGRDGILSRKMRGATRLFVASMAERDEIAEGGEGRDGLDWVGWENEDEANHALARLLTTKLDSMKAGLEAVESRKGNGGGMREDVRAMSVLYLRGQCEILEKAYEVLGEEMTSLYKRAKEAGVDLEMSDEEDDDVDDDDDEEDL